MNKIRYETEDYRLSIMIQLKVGMLDISVSCRMIYVCTYLRSQGARLHT